MRRSIPAFVFFLCVPLLVCLAVFTTQFKTDISAFVIAGDNAEEILLASEIQSGALSRRYILSVDAGGSQQVSAAFIQGWLKHLKSISGVVDVWTTDEKRGVLEALSSVYAKHGAQLYSRNPEQDLAEIFTETALLERAAGLKQALLSPQGQLIKKIAVQDPLLISLNGFKAFATQLQNQTSKHSQYANFILETQMSGMDVPAQLKIQQKIKDSFASATQLTGNNYQLDMTGVPLFAVATQTMIENDVKFISIFSSIALMLLFLFIFRSFRVLLWVFSLLITVMAVAVLVTNLVFGSVHGMTIAIGSTLIGICIDYPIHALVHAQGLQKAQRINVIKKIFPSLLMGALTTLIGYVALGLSGYPGFQQVAVYTGSGIIVSLLLTRYLFPRLMIGEAKNSKPSRFIVFWPKFCQRYRWGLLAGVGALSVVGAVQLDRLQWMQDLQQLTPELDYLKLTDKKIRERIISVEPGRFVLVSGETVEQTLQSAEQVYQRLDGIKKTGDLDDYFGLYPWLLSAQQQLANQQLLLNSLNEEQRESWGSALQAHGLSVRRLGELDYMQNEPLTLQQVLQSPVAKLISNQIVVAEQRTLLIIWLSEHKPEAIQSALADLQHVQYFSQRDMLNHMAIDYQHRAEITLLAGLALIILLLGLRYKSLVLTLQTLSPAFLAALMILALWAWTGEAISFLHLIGFLLAVAICVDYGIFYQENRSGHLTLTYQAMAASMLTSALVFGCLIFAQTSMLQTLAKVVSCGVILGFLLCPILIRPKEPDQNN
ncbi:MMPL family transporter [Methyloprofundus sp.]|uniref:MMPL family transporter n=1 Tax=Methyloprofundus sp. TaxID=2020875 RepID=UPI003D0C6694